MGSHNPHSGRPLIGWCLHRARGLVLRLLMPYFEPVFRRQIEFNRAIATQALARRAETEAQDQTPTH